MSKYVKIASQLDSQEIVLKPRDLVIIGCVAGVGIGIGAFGLLHYLTTNSSGGSSSSNNDKKKGKKYPNRTRPERVNTSHRAYLSQVQRSEDDDGFTNVNEIETENEMDEAKDEIGNLEVIQDTQETETQDTTATLSPVASSFAGRRRPSLTNRLSLVGGYSNATLFKTIELLPKEDQLKKLKEQNTKLSNLLQMTENMHYGATSSDQLTPNDIETLRAIFDSIDKDEDGCISGINELVELYSALGEPITDKEAKKLLKNKKLIPDKSGQVAFSNFLPFWQMTHRGSKKNKYYSEKFKFIYAKLKGNFDINNVVLANVGAKATTEYRINFYYKLKSGQSQRISPWHDIPLHHLSIGKSGYKSKLYNFICEVPKWTRAKYEIATGEPYNPIHQDVKNGNLRYYKHGDMMFNYGALPQTWEDPNHVPEETGCPGDNDPLDCIEIGTRQLPTGSVTPVKILGVLALLDSGETDWKLLAININDDLAPKLNDVHDIETVMPGAIKAIREYLRIYKVCTGSAENTYAFRGEALNQEFAVNVIEETHEMWKSKLQTALGGDAHGHGDDDADTLTRPSVKGTVLTV